MTLYWYGEYTQKPIRRVFWCFSSKESAWKCRRHRFDPCAWIYLWAFYFVPLICISVFVPVPYCPDNCGFVVQPEVRQVDSSSSILLSQDCFGSTNSSICASSPVVSLSSSICAPSPVVWLGSLAVLSWEMWYCTGSTFKAEGKQHILLFWKLHFLGKACTMKCNQTQ